MIDTRSKPWKLTWCLSVLFLCAHSVTEVSAQAFCALRDPTQVVYDMFPAAQSYRSVVKTVGSNVRAAVRRELPLEMHFNELGRHTLYVALADGGIPLGLIHARSEPGKWGLIEVAWAISPDLRVLDARLQRCRAPECRELKQSSFFSNLANASVADLAEYLTDDADGLVPDLPGVTPQTEGLALAVLRSGLKTLVVTEYTWSEEEAQLLGLRSFSEETEIERIDKPYSAEMLAILERELGAESTGFAREDVHMFRVLDTLGEPLGSIFSSPWMLDQVQLHLTWILDARGRVKSILPRDAWPSDAVQTAFAAVVGRELHSSEDCATAVDLSALELALLAGFHRSG